ncbi:MAG: tRNA-dihydrouridine synthase [Anaerolineaceae bacterium]|nr:tRNA-dihydrouridine synthase [Anaerolineaceae bacterium]
MENTDAKLVKSPTFFIDSIPVYGDVLLAPMDGISDPPFRILTRKMGGAVNITGFVNTNDILRNADYLDKRLAFDPNIERPLAFQIFGSDPNLLLEAALRLQDRGPDFIDINMGCSAKVIRRKGAGSELMATPKTIAAIFKLLTRNLSIPVTGKIRLGIDDENLNHLEVAHIIEDNGGKMLAVHGRTRVQAYEGKANWHAIAEIKGAISIPVIGNGDIVEPEQIDQMKKMTNCDAVMIGRAAIGNPWIIAKSHRKRQPHTEIHRVMMEHLKSMIGFYGEDKAILLFRKHAKHYIASCDPPRAMFVSLLRSETLAEFTEICDEVFTQAK